MHNPRASWVRLPAAALATAVLSAALTGCDEPNALSAALDRSYCDDIQQLVEGKVEALSQPRDGAERWARSGATPP